MKEKIYKIFLELEKAFWLLYYDFGGDEKLANQIKDKLYEIRMLLKI